MRSIQGAVAAALLSLGMSLPSVAAPSVLRLQQHRWQRQTSSRVAARSAAADGRDGSIAIRDMALWVVAVIIVIGTTA